MVGKDAARLRRGRYTCCEVAIARAPEHRGGTENAGLFIEQPGKKFSSASIFCPIFCHTSSTYTPSTRARELTTDLRPLKQRPCL